MFPRENKNHPQFAIECIAIILMILLITFLTAIIDFFKHKQFVRNH